MLDVEAETVVKMLNSMADLGALQEGYKAERDYEEDLWSLTDGSGGTVLVVSGGDESFADALAAYILGFKGGRATATPIQGATIRHARAAPSDLAITDTVLV